MTTLFSSIILFQFSGKRFDLALQMNVSVWLRITSMSASFYQLLISWTLFSNHLYLDVGQLFLLVFWRVRPKHNFFILSLIPFVFSLLIRCFKHVCFFQLRNVTLLIWNIIFFSNIECACFVEVFIKRYLFSLICWFIYFNITLGSGFLQGLRNGLILIKSLQYILLMFNQFFHFVFIV